MLRGLTRTRQRMCRHDRPPRQHNEDAVCGGAGYSYMLRGRLQCIPCGVTGARVRMAPMRKG